MTTLTTTAANNLSLENCDNEPVHIPGHIQDIAVLIGLDDSCTHVIYCSDNAESVFKRPAIEVLGLQLKDLLDESIIHELHNALSLSTARVQREHVGQWHNGERLLELWTHYSNSYPVLEFELIEDEAMGSYEAIKNIRSLLAHLGHVDGIERALHNAVVGLRDLSGFDRVMVYQFDSNGDGEIKAEAKGLGAESFLGLRFPRWDIPKQAREIMKKIPLRLIADVHATPVPLLALKSDSPPLDLTLAASRGQSPIHSEYLINLGVRATMTLTINIQGEVWGMVAFHHLSPRFIGPALRGAAELFVQFFSMQLEQRIDRENNRVNTRSSSYESALIEASETASNVTDLVRSIAAPICEHVESDGLAIITKDSIFQHGLTPTSEMIRKIAQHLLSDNMTDHASTSQLLAEGFSVAPCAGAMALTINSENQDFLLFFRQETVMSVTWAGAPEKHIVHGESGPRLSPRGSFEAYQQVVKNQSRAWESIDLLAANQLRQALTKANFHRLNKKSERQRTIYIDELNHRIRNILALIRSLARRTKESSSSLESYAKALEQRIAALGAAHDLAANNTSTGVEINKVFQTEMQPFTSDAQSHLNITGDNYLVRADIVPIFALIAHELMTNCVKHGALSVPDGTISVHISGNANGVTINWTETGGPTTEPPKNNGFGLSLITEVIPYELDGTSQLEFLPEGLRASFWLPASVVVSLSETENNDPSLSDPITADYSDLPKQVLIVEDSMMVAIELADMLEHIGVKHVEKCSSVAHAKSTLDHFTPDFAVLDVGLRDSQSFEVADILTAKQIPFCFATGYGSNFSAPEHLQNHTALTKPVDISELQKTIQRIYTAS